MVYYGIPFYPIPCFSMDLRNIVDFLYSGLVRTTSKRHKILRQAAVTLGVARLVDVIDELITSETDLSYSTGNILHIC